jgi:MFS family permease
MIVQTVEQIGDSLTLMALIAWAMAMPNHGATANLTILLFWIGLPIILVSPFSGAIIDRLSRKNLMIAATTMKGSFIFLIFMYLREPHLTPLLYMLVFMKSLSTQFFIPAKSAFLPDVVEKPELLARANSISATAMIITQILTYAAAGLLIAEIDPDNVLLLSSALYIPATLLIVFINAREQHKEPGRMESFEHIFVDIYKGFTVMWSLERIKFMTRRVFYLMICVIIFYVAMTGGALEDILKAGSIKLKPIAALGLIQGALGMGLVMGVIFIDKLIKRFSETNLVRALFPVLGLLIIGLYFIPNFYYLIAIALVGGAAGVVVLSVSETVVQHDAPTETRGRILAVFYLFKNSGPLVASALAGFMIRFISEQKVLLIAGAALLIYGLVSMAGKKRVKKG